MEPRSCIYGEHYPSPRLGCRIQTNPQPHHLSDYARVNNLTSLVYWHLLLQRSRSGPCSMKFDERARSCPRVNEAARSVSLLGRPRRAGLI